MYVPYVSIIHQVLEMEPRHFGALRGLGLLRMKLKVRSFPLLLGSTRSRLPRTLHLQLWPLHMYVASVFPIDIVEGRLEFFRKLRGIRSRAPQQPCGVLTHSSPDPPFFSQPKPGLAYPIARFLRAHQGCCHLSAYE